MPFIIFFLCPVEVFSQDASIKPENLVDITQTVKTLIEENKGLASDKEKLTGDLQELKKKQSTIESRLKEMSQEKEKLSSRLKEAAGEKDKSGQEVKRLEQNVKALEEIRAEDDQKIKELEAQLVKKEETPREYVKEELPQPLETLAQETVEIKEEAVPAIPASPPIAIKLNEEKEAPAAESPGPYANLDLLARIELSAKKDRELKENAARVHYNMGNSYVKKGEYASAVQEYKEALKLLPNDADTYYNLAFVHDEHLKDFKTALSYYQKYLELRPDAPDKETVTARIEALRSASK